MNEKDDELTETDAELAASLETENPGAIVTTPSPATPESLAATVSKALAPLAEKTANGLALAAKNLTEVLPVELYAGRSTLAITNEERESLEKYSVAGDEDLDIRPDGLVYATHMFYRRALTDTFGPGGWADVPVSPIQVEKSGEAIHVYQRWALYVHGAYISEAIGAGTYWANNDKMDKTDAAEIARSQALTRNASKSSLGIATNPWVRREANAWRKRCCKQVLVDTGGMRKIWWRRNDAEEFTDRDGRVIEKGDFRVVQPPQATQPVVGSFSTSTDGHSTEPPAKRGRPPKVQGEETPAKETLKEHTEPPVSPPAPADNFITEPQMRLFIAESRRRGLIKDKDATAGINFLVEQTGFSDASKLTGKTSMEACVFILRRITDESFRSKILPALRAK